MDMQHVYNATYNYKGIFAALGVPLLKFKSPMQKTTPLHAQTQMVPFEAASIPPLPA